MMTNNQATTPNSEIIRNRVLHKDMFLVPSRKDTFKGELL